MVQCSQAICTKASCSPSLTDEGLHDRLFLPNCSSSLAARHPHQAIWPCQNKNGCKPSAHKGVSNSKLNPT